MMIISKRYVCVIEVKRCGGGVCVFRLMKYMLFASLAHLRLILFEQLYIL